MPAADKETIAYLNDLLKNKLTSINQYFLHARMLKHAGDVRRADDEYKASIDAMKHSDMLVEHILRLGGKPGLQELNRLMIGDTADEMLRNDLVLAETALVQLMAAIASCKAKGDQATAALLARIMETQQGYIEAVRVQIDPTKLKECA